MIYTLVSETQECLASLIDDIVAAEQDNKIKLIRQQQEIEQVTCQLYCREEY